MESTQVRFDSRQSILQSFDTITPALMSGCVPNHEGYTYNNLRWFTRLAGMR